MPRLFVGNFSFEQQLGNRKRENLPRHLLSLNADLSAVWLAITQSGDVIYAPNSDPFNLNQLATDLNQPDVRFIADLRELENPPLFELVPWGWNSEIALIATSFLKQKSLPDLTITMQANSRATSFKHEQHFQTASHEFTEHTSYDELILSVTQLLLRYPKIVLKSEFSMSGRERLILNQGTVTVQESHWIKHRLAQGFRIYLEPWLHKICELSTHYVVESTGKIERLGMTPLLTSQRGEHRGNLLGLSITAGDSTLLESISDYTLKSVSLLKELGYVGPVSIDSMIYRDLEQRIQVRPLQDINARWSMGRLGYEMGRRYAPGSIALWHHFRQDQPRISPHELMSEINRISKTLLKRDCVASHTQTLSTSPSHFGHEAVRFQTELIVFQ